MKLKFKIDKNKINMKSLKGYIPLISISTFYFLMILMWYQMKNIFPTFNEAMRIGDSDLSFLGFILGIVGLPGYFVGGWLAEKFNPKRLVVFAGLIMALTGFWWSTIAFGVNDSHGLEQFYVIYGIWGATQGFIFYVAYVKLLQSLAPKDNQIQLFAKSRIFTTVLALILILGLGYVLKSTNTNVLINGHQVTLAIPILMVVISLIVLSITIYTQFKIKFIKVEEKKVKLSKKETWEVIKNPRVWFMAFLVLSFALLMGSMGTIGVMLKKNLGLSESVLVPFNTLTSYGDPIILTPIMFYIGRKAKSYTKTVIILLVMMISTISLCVLFPIFRTPLGTTIAIVLVMIFYAISGFILSTLWTVRYAQAQELNIHRRQYGVALGIFTGVASSEEAWIGYIESYVKGKWSETDKNGFNIASLKGNQIFIIISISLGLFFLVIGSAAYFLNRRDYIKRGKDTFRIIKEDTVEEVVKKERKSPMKKDVLKSNFKLKILFIYYFKFLKRRNKLLY